MRCIAKPMRHPSPSTPSYHEKNLSPPRNNEVEPGRFRSCLKIHLETNESTDHRSRASSATSKHHQRQQTISDDDIPEDEEFLPQRTLSPTNFYRDHQAVFL
jgi:hypothetical protein